MVPYSRISYRCACVLLWCLASLGGPLAQPQQATLSGSVLDEAGRPLWARVTVGPTAEEALAVGFTDEDGRFGLPSPPGKVVVTASRGPEWEPQEAVLDLPPGGARCQLRLRRLVDMAGLGWYGGDGHMHSTHSDGEHPPEVVARAARCEGLSWAVLTDHNSLAGGQEWLSQRAADFLPILGEEISTDLGHLVAWGLSELVDWRVQRPEGLRGVFEAVHRQGALLFLAHPVMPTASKYQGWDVEGYDGLEVFNAALPPYGGIFDLLQARKRWYRLLSEGRRVVGVANSDCHDPYKRVVREALADLDAAKEKYPQVALGLAFGGPQALPYARRSYYLGSARNYVQASQLSQQAILAAVRQQRMFVTTGPLILATLEGQHPGTEIKLTATRQGQRGRLEYRAVSNQDLEKLVVVMDGEPRATVDLTGEREASGELLLDLAGARWATVECYGQWPGVAVTNPWYMAP
ncbi:MAG: CehA/McbA family metallohydrolase [Armatimonadota bacterium]